MAVDLLEQIVGQQIEADSFTGTVGKTPEHDAEREKYPYSVFGPIDKNGQREYRKIFGIGYKIKTILVCKADIKNVVMEDESNYTSKTLIQ